ncbi:oxidoreductase [Mucilaginibacter hurinus]|uniref:Oxidoreductase n=1 Tax=Mucilaginibacter hurinus TaxID=2201324 RepID=A0A367GRC3_9SPHI|nr:putative oxidoreductase C-terminal domain-containing protein [Mucilaginibacter hurinus]RCH56014.1 oxidoreductase [Mucilaginibacter hurinus]
MGNLNLGILGLIMLAVTCNGERKGKSVKLITLDPGHFHAALVQKSMYPDVDSVVYVYAPEGPDVQLHLDKIAAYNGRAEQPTAWKEDVYKGKNFFNKMLEERKGNVVVMAGNNRLKTEYIKKSVNGGFNVLADKPMAIDNNNFELLKEAFTTAAEKKLLLYDIMTERYEITNILQRELAMIPGIFGKLQAGTPENPAVEMESVHYFYKYVSGSILTRPAWFFDVEQEGDGMADVGVHLVDLAQWSCFPESIIDYKKDITFNSAKRWPTALNRGQFFAITKQSEFPDYLKKYIVKDTVLNVFANGEINYKLRGVNIKLLVKWDYQAPAGAGDTHYSVIHGTKASLVIKQGAETANKPALYIESAKAGDMNYVDQVNTKMRALQAKYPGVELKKIAKGWEVVIPDKYREGHEAHFARVTEKYLDYLHNGNMPGWEVPNMIAKYYTTTSALRLAKK